MKLTNLEKDPQFVQEVLNLIENSFGYTKDSSFAVDFYPLMKKENHQNCYLLIDKGIVIAHTAQLTRDIEFNGKTYPVSMYGGIAVHQSYQGKGIFKKIFNEVTAKYTNFALHFLWSEKIDLYGKFNFYPAIEMYQYNKLSYQHSPNVIETKLSLLSKQDKQEVYNLYKKNSEIRIKRNTEHWLELECITSSKLFLIKEQDRITNYFIMNKGADLTNTIHEYGFIDSIQLRVMLNFGNVWSASLIDDIKSESLYSSLIKPGDFMLFSNLMLELFNTKILEIKDDQIKLELNGQEFQVPLSDFLNGAMGPGKYKELSASPSFYICGMDSI